MFDSLDVSNVSLSYHGFKPHDAGIPLRFRFIACHSAILAARLCPRGADSRVVTPQNGHSWNSGIWSSYPHDLHSLFHLVYRVRALSGQCSVTG